MPKREIQAAGNTAVAAAMCSRQLPFQARAECRADWQTCENPHDRAGWADLAQSRPECQDWEAGIVPGPPAAKIHDETTLGPFLSPCSSIRTATTMPVESYSGRGLPATDRRGSVRGGEQLESLRIGDAFTVAGKPPSLLRAVEG